MAGFMQQDVRTVAAFVYECFLVRSGGLEPVTDSHQHGNMIPSSGATLMSGDLAGGDEWSTSLSMCSICDDDLLSCDSVYLSCVSTGATDDFE